MDLTKHAMERKQQRGIPPLIVDWLLEFGAEERAPGGTTRWFFDKGSRRRLAKEVGEQVVDRLGDLLGIYLVQSNEDGAVITIGHRTGRFRGH